MKRPFPVWLALAASGGLLQARQANVNLDWNPEKNTQDLVPYGANVISPEVKDDDMVTFRLKAPDAREALLSGEPALLALNAAKPVPFTKGPDGLWTLTVGPIEPNLYVYKFVIDGVTTPGPNKTPIGFSD
jgi:1,4-alpha-glucan branching enzyme